MANPREQRECKNSRRGSGSPDRLAAGSRSASAVGAFLEKRLLELEYGLAGIWEKIGFKGQE
jgi:hypothetical protein